MPKKKSGSHLTLVRPPRAQILTLHVHNGMVDSSTQVLRQDGDVKARLVRQNLSTLEGMTAREFIEDLLRIPVKEAHRG